MRKTLCYKVTKARGDIPCQITQWIKPYPLQIGSYLVYGVIWAENAKILIFSTIGRMVLALWHAQFCDFGRNWPRPLIFKSPYLCNPLAKSGIIYDAAAEKD